MLFKRSDTYKWVVLAISFMLMLTFAISLQSLPPIFDKIGKDISFSNSQAGMLMGAYAIPGIFLPFLIAFLASRYNKKSIILIALLILIFGLIAFSRSESFSALLTSRLVTGIGATALVILAPLLVTIFFDQKNMGIAMGIFNAAVPFGTVIAANLFGILGEKIHWRSIILGIAVFVGIVFVISIFTLSLPKKKERDGSKISPKESSKGLFSNVSLWFLALIWILGNAQLLSYVTFAPQYFQSTGMTLQRAGLLTSFIMLVPIFLSPLVGIIIDKTGWKRRLLLIGSVIMAISFILISRGTFALPIWALTLGIGFSPIPVFVFSLLPELIQPHQMGMGLGVITIAANLGIALGPLAFGFLLDKTGGNFNLGFIILALISIGIIFALGGLKTTQK
ncbi:MAG: MFS transporter [Tissierellia bacterium]|nr:MFS transporter [Tissierellia bacterium]